MALGTTLATPDTVETVRRRWIFRHPLVIRVTHWVNVVCLAVLLMSGLQIFNAHPALYWGSKSTFDDPAFLITDDQAPDGRARGIVQVGGRTLETTGVLGLSSVNGEDAGRAFPAWVTLPAGQDLATGRRWHFLFAWAFVINGLIYLAYGLGSGQLRNRVVPDRDQLRDIGGSVKEHLLLHFAQGEAAKRYNVLQKLTYLVVIVALLPLMLLTGLAMSPGVDAIAPFLLDVFGGRQSARTIHFIVVNLLVLFVIVHVALVVLSGLWNNMRAMTTGWFVIEKTKVSGSGEAR